MNRPPSHCSHPPHLSKYWTVDLERVFGIGRVLGAQGTRPKSVMALAGGGHDTSGRTPCSGCSRSGGQGKLTFQGLDV